jgi:hypothetical protein
MTTIYHLVLLKFAPQKLDRVAPLFADLESLRKKIPGFLTITGGPYASPEGANQGYTHGIVMTFVDAATRDHYLTHPDHEKLKQAFLPDLEGVIAFDFEGD